MTSRYSLWWNRCSWKSRQQATLEVLTAFDRSSTNSRNSIGPSRDPCGTPDVTGSSREIAPRTVNCCLRPYKYERNQSWSLLAIPYWCNLPSSLVWSLCRMPYSCQEIWCLFVYRRQVDRQCNARHWWAESHEIYRLKSHAVRGWRGGICDPVDPPERSARELWRWQGEGR